MYTFRKYSIFWLFFILLILIVISLSTGEIEISLHDVFNGILYKSSNYNNKLIHEIRLPRILAGIFIGGTLSVSGLITSITLKNPLADSGILGIQSGASVGAISIILILPHLSGLYPLFAFIGGLTAFTILMLASSKGFGDGTSSIILNGVAINSIGTSIIGIITLLNVNRIRDTLSWMSGSLSGISSNNTLYISIYSILGLAVAFALLPILKILLLNDEAIINLGYKLGLFRSLAAVVAVLLASIGVSYAGIFSFIGIIAPQLARKIVGHSLKKLLLGTAIIGAVLTAGTDLLQRVIFSPREIPAGVLIGLIGAPLFISLSRKKNYG